LSTPAAKRKTQEIGSVVDDFTLPDLRGGNRSLSYDIAGKKGAVVVFWSSVCSHCIRYDPYMNGFTAKHPELALIAVASRQGETPDQIRKTADERRLAFPIVHDANGSIARNWFTEQTPRAFLLDANRALLYRGAIDNYKFPGDAAYLTYLEPAIAEFLAGKPIRQPETASFGCAIQSVYYILPRPL
jgi:peroxiredoxin